MVNPAHRASGMAGNADANKTATKATEKARVSQTVESLRKEQASRRANAKDNKASAPSKSFPKPEPLIKHKAAQLHIATSPKSDAPKAPVDALDSLHRAVAATPIDKPTKIHFKATTGPPPNPTYFISERRTHTQRVKKKIAEAEGDKRRYSQKAGQSRSSDGNIKLTHWYWFSRFGGFAIFRDEYMTYYEFAHTNVGWEDKLVGVPFGKRCRMEWRSTWFTPK